MVAAELVDEGSVNNHMPTVIEIGVLDDKINTTCLSIGLLHRRNVVSLCGQARVMADLFSASKTVAWVTFVLSVCFLQVWMCVRR